jgi:hypothetical protein
MPGNMKTSCLSSEGFDLLFLEPAAVRNFGHERDPVAAFQLQYCNHYAETTNTTQE